MPASVLIQWQQELHEKFCLAWMPPGAGPTAPAAVACDRSLCTDNDDVVLLTWGSPVLDDLLDRLARRHTR